MGRVFQNTGGSVTEMFRRDPRTGKLVKVMPEFSEYQTPPRGTRARLVLSGISDEFEMDSQFSDHPEPRIRVEFTILKVSGNAKMLVGKRFTDIYPAKSTPNSKFGKLLARLREKPIAKGENSDVDAYIGAEFTAITDTTDSGEYAKLPEGSIEDGSIALYDPPAFWEAQRKANLTAEERAKEEAAERAARGEPADEGSDEDERELVGVGAGPDDDAFGLDEPDF
jgi:hypothetical protein